MLAVRYQEPSAVPACVCESNLGKALRSQPRNKAAQSRGETPATAKGSWAAIVVSCISQQIYCRLEIWAASLLYRLLISLEMDVLWPFFQMSAWWLSLRDIRSFMNSQGVCMHVPGLLGLTLWHLPVNACTKKLPLSWKSSFHYYIS